MTNNNVVSFYRKRQEVRLRSILEHLTAMARALPPCETTEARLGALAQRIDELAAQPDEALVQEGVQHG